ncbi:MAG: hypothetical protein IPL52_10675 [Flavobacteriales bacterium]|nr:hypothetical protein [Flavobacteriales bacterium]
MNRQNLRHSCIFDATGRELLSTLVSGGRTSIPFAAAHGAYLARLGKDAQAMRFVR